MNSKTNKKAPQTPAKGLENEGEGNKTAARHYNESTRKFVEGGKVDEAAQRAEEALEGPEGEELRRAEEEGKSHASDIEKNG